MSAIPVTWIGIVVNKLILHRLEDKDEDLEVQTFRKTVNGKTQTDWYLGFVPQRRFSTMRVNHVPIPEDAGKENPD